jgi:hypothetical protein
MPRGLIVVLGESGILVGVLALRQFAEILGPVLLALVLAAEALSDHIASAADGQGSVGQGSRSSITESTPD